MVFSCMRGCCRTRGRYNVNRNNGNNVNNPAFNGSNSSQHKDHKDGLLNAVKGKSSGRQEIIITYMTTNNLTLDTILEILKAIKDNLEIQPGFKSTINYFETLKHTEDLLNELKGKHNGRQAIISAYMTTNNLTLDTTLEILDAIKDKPGIQPGFKSTIKYFETKQKNNTVRPAIAAVQASSLNVALLTEVTLKTAKNNVFEIDSINPNSRLKLWGLKPGEKLLFIDEKGELVTDLTKVSNIDIAALMCDPAKNNGSKKNGSIRVVRLPKGLAKSGLKGYQTDCFDVGTPPHKKLSIGMHAIDFAKNLTSSDEVPDQLAELLDYTNQLFVGKPYVGEPKHKVVIQHKVKHLTAYRPNHSGLHGLEKMMIAVNICDKFIKGTYLKDDKKDHFVNLKANPQRYAAHLLGIALSRAARINESGSGPYKADSVKVFKFVAEHVGFSTDLIDEVALVMNNACKKESASFKASSNGTPELFSIRILHNLSHNSVLLRCGDNFTTLPVEFNRDFTDEFYENVGEKENFYLQLMTTANTYLKTLGEPHIGNDGKRKVEQDAPNRVPYILNLMKAAASLKTIKS